MNCPVCDGKGEFVEYIDHWVSDRYDCPYCDGKGKISILSWLRYYFWNHMPDWYWDFAYWLYEKSMKGED